MTASVESGKFSALFLFKIKTFFFPSSRMRLFPNTKCECGCLFKHLDESMIRIILGVVLGAGTSTFDGSTREL